SPSGTGRALVLSGRDNVVLFQFIAPGAQSVGRSIAGVGNLIPTVGESQSTPFQDVAIGAQGSVFLLGGAARPPHNASLEILSVRTDFDVVSRGQTNIPVFIRLSNSGGADALHVTPRLVFQQHPDGGVATTDVSSHYVQSDASQARTDVRSMVI